MIDKELNLLREKIERLQARIRENEKDSNRVFPTDYWQAFSLCPQVCYQTGMEANLLVIKNDSIVHKSGMCGIIAALDTLENKPDILINAIVIDKIVGKAAAFIFACAKVKYVHGSIMSKPALEVLKQHSIDCSFSALTEQIENRTKTDMCPIEQSVIDITQPSAAIDAIKKRLSQLRINEK